MGLLARRESRGGFKAAGPFPGDLEREKTRQWARRRLGLTSPLIGRKAGCVNSCDRSAANVRRNRRRNPWASLTGSASLPLSHLSDLRGCSTRLRPASSTTERLYGKTLRIFAISTSTKSRVFEIGIPVPNNVYFIVRLVSPGY